MERLVGSAGFPWWWHTKDDTIDKIDADVLVLTPRSISPPRCAG